VIVRAGTGADGDALAGVQERAWRRAYAHVFPADELARDGFVDPAAWRRRLEQPPRGWSTFVADGAGGVLGYVVVGPSRDRRSEGEVYALYADPAVWSTGVGRALLAHAQEHLALRYARATLWVLEENARARRFYERCGWAADGARKIEGLRWDVRAPQLRYATSLRRPSP
jgi:ribosomal protein S18 acetylase RimI-like enzyme